MAVRQEIKFVNVDGEEVTEVWHFSLGQTDVMNMDLAHHEDVEGYLSEILRNKDTKRLLEVWQELLFRAVAKREGSLLLKDDEHGQPGILRAFRYGGAFEQFFSEIVQAPDAGASFFLSIMPANVQEEVAKKSARVYTDDELLAMTDDEFAKVAGKDIQDMTKEHMLLAFKRKTMKPAA